MDQDFASALSELITRYKEREALGEMVAELEGAVDGLKQELEG